jgi:hypothetical protein
MIYGLIDGLTMKNSIRIVFWKISFNGCWEFPRTCSSTFELPPTNLPEIMFLSGTLGSARAQVGFSHAHRALSSLRLVRVRLLPANRNENVMPACYYYVTTDWPVNAMKNEPGQTHPDTLYSWYSFLVYNYFIIFLARTSSPSLASPT